MTYAAGYLSTTLVLLCRSHDRLCALPLAHVLETMRALPAAPVPDMPPFLLGVSIIRGAVVPVLDVARLVSPGATAGAQRFVTIKLGARQVALAFDDVIGVRTMDTAALAEIVPLLQHADGGMLQAVAMLDAELLLVLQAARLMPDSVWQAIESRGPGA